MKIRAGRRDRKTRMFANRRARFSSLFLSDPCKLRPQPVGAEYRLIVASNFSSLAQADSYSDSIEVFQKSPAVQPFFKNCYGYAVFPTIGKGGIGIGGAYGKGQGYQGGKVTGTASLIKVSVGWQLGGQAFSEIIFFQDKRAYDEFTSGNFEFDATASAVAISSPSRARGPRGSCVH